LKNTQLFHECNCYFGTNTRWKYRGSSWYLKYWVIRFISLTINFVIQF
jgi:hypothetical protein